MTAFDRNGPVRSDSSEFHCTHRPEVSDSSGGVGLVCGMKRGIFKMNSLRAGSFRRADLHILRVET